MASVAPRFTLREAPREARTQRFQLGMRHAVALLVSVIYVAVAVVLVGWLHLPSVEAVGRGTHLALLFGGPAPSALAFDLARPPLLSALALPFAAVPALRDHGLAVAIGTAMTGGIGVLVTAGIARWAAMGRTTTVLFVAAFALHPLLVYSGAVGLPEALYATVVLGGFGQVLRWLRREDTAAVIGAGAWMGLAVLIRYDSVWVTLAMAWLLYRVAQRRGGLVDGRDSAQATLAAFLTPVVFTTGFWGLITWIVTGSGSDMVTLAARLSGFAGTDPAFLKTMEGMRANVPAIAQWMAEPLALIALPSLLAVLALVGNGLIRRRSEPSQLAVALTAIALPPVVGLLTGQAQPHVPHLFALVVPAFVALAYFASRTRSEEESLLDRRARRHRSRLAGVTLALLLASFGSAVAIPALPAADPPGERVVAAIRSRAPAQAPDDVRRTARWLVENAGPGEVVADAERAAPVIMESGRYDLFRTPVSNRGEAIAFDPFNFAKFLLLPRPVPGSDDDLVQRAHPGLFTQGAPYATLAFEAGNYRVFRISTVR